MNTTTEFIHNFNSDDLSTTILNFFDEIMVLYNLVGNRQDLDICTDNNVSLATFILLMESEKDAKELYNHLNASSFSVYNDVFDINMELNGASVISTIITASSV